MSDRIDTLLAENGSGAPQLIIDATAYARRVLLQDRTLPWQDATAYSNHLHQIQALLQPAVALVPLDLLIEHYLDQHPSLRESMAAQSRPGYAARVLLREENLKQKASEIVFAASKTLRQPILLQLLSPLSLLRQLNQASDFNARGLEYDDDDAAETAAVYYSDWLRIFADLGVSGLLFDERSGKASAETYSPVTNAAEHYRWSVGLRSESTVQFLSPAASVPVLEPSFWAGDAEPPSGGVFFTEIPADAIPERVLERLTSLRA